jgi:squalene-hopene/tetraprenyl-beta-curcumene cyclase
VVAPYTQRVTRVLLSLYGIWIGAACRKCRLKQCCCRVGFRSPVKVSIGREQSWCRCWFCRYCVRARSPLGIRIDELFIEPPFSIGPAAKAHTSAGSGLPFCGVDSYSGLPSSFSKTLRQRAIDRATYFVNERLNGEDGLGAIFPAMANAAMMFDAGNKIGPPSRAIRLKIAGYGQQGSYRQPCVSPVWDTGLTCRALLEIGNDEARASASAA